MANHSELRFRKGIKWPVIKKEIERLIETKIGMDYTIQKDRDGIYIGFNQEEWDAPSIIYWPRYKDGLIKALEWSDNCFRQTDAGWFSCYINSSLGEKFKSKIYSEGVGESYKSDFHIEYPTPASWIIRRDGFLKSALLKIVFKGRMEELKKQVPESVYKFFSRVKR